MITIEKLKTILRLADIEGYIEYHGAPEDEYDSEALAIFAALDAATGKEMTEDNATFIISEIWKKSFNLDADDMKKREAGIGSMARAIIN